MATRLKDFRSVRQTKPLNTSTPVRPWESNAPITTKKMAVHAQITKSNSAVRWFPSVTGLTGPTGLTVANRAAVPACVIALVRFYFAPMRLTNAPVVTMKLNRAAMMAAVPKTAPGPSGVHGPNALLAATAEFKSELAT